MFWKRLLLVLWMLWILFDGLLSAFNSFLSQSPDAKYIGLFGFFLSSFPGRCAHGFAFDASKTYTNERAATTKTE